MNEIHKSETPDNNIVRNFDPDKRIDINENVDIVARYNPDKRIETYKSLETLSFEERLKKIDERNEQEKAVICKDDNENIYLINGKRIPNTSYKLNGNTYITDDKGRIVHCEAKPHRSPENPRDNDAQMEAGGDDRHPNDQGGHIIGRDLNGDGGGGNLVAMDSRINQSDYKRMENDIKSALDEGKEVFSTTEITYSGDSERPDKIITTVTVDGKDTIYKFDNNMDETLKSEISENGEKIVQAKLEDTGGVISSIKEKYDENGNLSETTVWITYTGDNGENYRTNVKIDN